MEELSKLEANIKENLQDIDQVSKLSELLQTGDYKFQAKVGLCISRVLEEYWKAEILQDERLTGLSTLLWKLFEDGSESVLSFLLKSEDDEIKAKWTLKFLSYIKIELLHKKIPISQNTHFFKLIKSLLESQFFNILRYIMKEYQDIATESAKVISLLVKDEEFDLNIIYEFLSQIPSPNKLKENVFYPELAPPSLISKKRKRKENFDPELTGQRILVDSDSWAIRYKQSIGQIWKELTELDLEATDIKFLLKALCKYGLPNVADPLMFSDFYLKSFDNGGNIAVLALSGLFILMTKHGLEAKQYYMKLYQLIRTQLQKGKTLSKSFLKLLELSLSSPMLPSSLIGSFIKVLLKESLLSPVSTTLWAVAFAMKSFKIHSGLLPMINNNNKEDKFNYEELNPLYTKSIESSLWELMILKKHYHPKIRELVTEFEKPVEKMARVTTAEVMNLEVPQKRPKLNPKPFRGIFN